MQKQNDNEQPKRRGKTGLSRQRGSQNWSASYTDAGGKRVRRSTGTADRREAEALLAKWRLEEFRVRQWDEEPARTFDALMLEYLKETQKQKQKRIQSAARRLYAAFAGRVMNDLTRTDVRGYVRNRRAEGVKAGTVNREISLLSAAINHARHEWGWDIPNPTAKCKSRENEGRVRWISRDEADSLIEAAGVDPRAASHLPAFIRLAVNTGMRCGELLGLEWSRVDLSRNLLFLEAEHTKTRKRRSIPLNQEARAALLDRARFRAAHCPGSPWVFCHQDGSRIRYMTTAFRTALKRARITDFRIHDLRHTCAAWLVTEGVPLTSVRDLLGHKTIAMTERYAHLAPERAREAVEVLDREDGHKIGIAAKENKGALAVTI